MIDATSQNHDQKADNAPTEVDFVALRPGQTIGRYEITSVLGQGGFGITYRARDTQLNRDVAIKEYLPTALAVRQDGITVLPRSTKVADDFSWGRQRFVEEGRTLASLEHAPAIVQVFDFLEANGTAYIVMKLVPGDTLEGRIRKGALSPAEIDRILWPLLDGMERVHGAGFLHRDIKPANILLDARGSPTLIDFGASRAAMAGRTSAMTAIFTPGYAAAEQMTSAKQGPWTDIYGIAATIYHAVTGAPPPSAFDRMLDDTCEPLAKLAPDGFSPGLLIGIDAGLAVRASDRPQTIAGWRLVLGQATVPDAQATVALARPADPNATQVVRRPTVAPAAASVPDVPAVPEAPDLPRRTARAGRRPGRWIVVVAAVLLLGGGGGGYRYMAEKTAREESAAAAASKAKAEAAAATADAKERAAREDAAKAEAELQKMREEQAARERAETEAALRKQLEEEARKKIEQELAEKQKAEQEEKARAAAELAERQKTADETRKTAEAAEAALKLSTLDHQHVQVALTALGFNTNGTDGVFGQHSRDTIAAWQAARSYPATGFLTGLENQALLRDAAPAIARFDEEQKKADEARKKEEERTKTAVTAVAPPAARPNPVAAQPPPAPAPGAATPADGMWQGTYDCQAGKDPSRAPPFTAQVRAVVTNGYGIWVPPVMRGTLSIALQVQGEIVTFTRTVLNQGDQTKSETHLPGKFSGSTITGSGHERPFGRVCTVVLARINLPEGTHQGSGGGLRRHNQVH
jgi:serine/threonine protein kinase/peptidoglycan hydrolase-like protein with peptidoglycan-binding domain